MSSGLLKDILLGETRYEREFFKRIRRNLRLKLDFYFSWGYTLRKMIIRHKAVRKPLFETFGATSLLLFSSLVNKLRSMKFVSFDDKLTAPFYLIIYYVMNQIDPKFFDLEEERPLSLQNGMLLEALAMNSSYLRRVIRNYAYTLYR